MLDYDYLPPAEPRDDTPVIVLLHGRGVDRRDLVPLHPRLPDGAGLVLPDAPFEAAPWGYGPGRAWYQFLGGDRPEPETFRESQRALDAFMDALPDALPHSPGPIVLGGFSQGGTMSLAYALRHGAGSPLIINFSGFLADHPDVDVSPENAEGLRIFWGHGTRDPNIPHALAERGRTALREAGADLDARDYPIGHAIDPRELADAVEWIQERAGSVSR
ncbi:MAG: alpha/beta hydrolase [Gemmatimonadota bacterium]